MQNLLGNALKFSRPNTPPQISITARQVGGKDVPVLVAIPRATAYWAIHINDNGIGFDSQYKEHIFGAFQRLHARNSTYPGTGIGLAIVKKVVDQHSGAIDVQSTPGEGSTFTVYLPV